MYDQYNPEKALKELQQIIKDIYALKANFEDVQK